MTFQKLVKAFQEDFGEKLRQATYLIADTRIPWVSLYDHLALTAGIAVAFTEELLARGKSPAEICGVDLPPQELRALACLCGLLHDLGKAKSGETEYRFHVQRGVEYAREWLAAKGVENQLQEVVLGAVARHHLQDQPRTILEKLVCLADSYASAGDRPELARATTREEFEKTLKSTRLLEEELFGTEKPLRLLLGDVDAIKNYVYETSALPDIRGGSEILQETEDDLRKMFQMKLAQEVLIYCGGGGFLAVVPSRKAQKLKREIEELYLEKTEIATITVVYSDPLGYADFARGLEPHDDRRVQTLSGNGVAGDLVFSHFDALLTERTRRKNFGELVSALAARLQYEKRAKSVTPFVESLPIHERCEACGKRPAQSRDDIRNEWLCSICYQKRERGRRGRRQFRDEFVQWAKEQGYTVSENLPGDLNVLAGSEGRIALLYADGNNMGDLLQLMPSPASYRHFSHVLARATRHALFSALWEVFGSRLTDVHAPLPFEIIAIGGDDIAVIVPASYGWILSLHVLCAFSTHPGIQSLENEFQKRLGNALHRPVALTLSAGLVIADVKYPMRFLFSLAEGLLKGAKKRAREELQMHHPGRDTLKARTSTLFHLWLRSPVVSHHPDRLIQSLYERENEPPVFLTARPYTLADAWTLTRIAKDLAFLPKTERRTLAEALEKGVHVSLNYALYQAARMNPEQKSRMLELFQELGNLLSPNGGFWFWRETDEGWKTALLDALELVELKALLDVPEASDYGAPALR